MGLIVTPGASTSNSFITAEEAGTIASSLGIDITSWTAPGVTIAQKEARLIFAADLIGDMFSFRGYKAYQYQRLCFPRANCQDLFNIPMTEIPEDVKKAQVYLAVDVVPRYFVERVSEQEGFEEMGDIASFTLRDVQVSFQQKTPTASDIIEGYVTGRHTLLYSLLSRYVAQLKIIDGREKTLLAAVEGQTTTSTTTTTTTTVTTTSTSTTTSTTTV